jgi:cystatin-C
MSLLLFLLVLGTTVGDAAATSSVAFDGKWQPITNFTDLHVQYLSKWVIAEHTKVYNDGLRFSKVVSGEVQIVASVNYRLDVDALRLDGKDAMYKAEVFEQDWPTSTTRKLISFDPVK